VGTGPGTGTGAGAVTDCVEVSEGDVMLPVHAEVIAPTTTVIAVARTTSKHFVTQLFSR